MSKSCVKIYLDLTNLKPYYLNIYVNCDNIRQEIIIII